MALVVSEVVMSAMGALVDMVDMVVMVDAEVTLVMATMVTDFFFLRHCLQVLMILVKVFFLCIIVFKFL